MIAKACVRIIDNRTNQKVDIPCHRHADAYEILYTLKIPYDFVDEGFLDDEDKFYTRREAYVEALRCEQLNDTHYFNHDSVGILYSEDLW